MTEDILDEPVLSGEDEVPPEPEAGPAPAEEPVEVVSVDELVDRLTGASETEGTGEQEEPAEDDELVLADPSPMEVEGMDEVLIHLETMEETALHPALETPVEEYTVTEGLLLLLLLLLVVSWCVKMIKGGFSWLLW